MGTDKIENDIKHIGTAVLENTRSINTIIDRLGDKGPRECVVTKKGFDSQLMCYEDHVGKGLWHKWAKIYDSENTGETIEVGIVEMEDGNIEEVSPKKIRFINNEGPEKKKA